MNTGKSKIISLILVLSILLSLVPVFHVEAQARTWSVNQQNIADRADFFFNATWVCQKTVYGWRDQFTYYEGETYHLPYGQPVNSGKFIGYGVELEEMLLAAADADSVFYSRQSEFNGWTSVYYATDCAAFVAMCWGTVRQDCSTLPYYSTYKGSPTESNIHNVLQLGDALDSTSVGHVVLVTDMIYDDSGELIQIEITEQTPPQLKRTLFTPAELAAKYAAEFGIYRYGGSVPAVPEWGYTAECNPLASYCKIEATEDCIVRSLPCSNSVDATSTELGSVRAGDILTATRLYENTVGELWYRIEFSDDTEGYIPAAGTKYLEQILEDIALTDSVAPNAHVKGTTYALVGNIYAKYNQLVTASAYIYQGFGTSGLAITGAEDYVTGNAYTLKSSNIDYSTSMGSLSTGKHTYAVSATYRNYYATGADSYEMNSGSLLLAEDYFMVISQSVSQTSCRHNYSETTLSAATCTQGQKTVYACATCGSVYTEEADAPGHAYGGWVETSPGCTESGFQTRSCTVCGNVETQVLPATRHDYIATEQAGDCTQHPCTAYTCSQCGDEYKIYSEDLMSEWLEALPEGIDPSMTESKLQYRQSALETVTSPESTLDGYYYISESWETAGTGKVDYVVTWPSGFDTGSELYAAYNNTPITGGEDESGLTKTVIDSTKVTGYLYYHWCYDGYPYTASYKHDSYNTFHAFYSTTDPATHDRYDSSDNSYSFQNECCDNSSWFFVTQVTTQSYTNYQKQFTHGKWSEFSQWQDEEIIASDTVKVETRTLYRYVNAELGDHNFENNICTVCGAVCEHDWTDGSCNVCGTICEHDWTDGTCGVCGAVCEHDWTDGTCGVCGAICEHDWTDGSCGVCGAICEHTWTDGTCGVCGAICEHTWTDGSCNVCGTICEHDWTDGTCGVCGAICEHTWTDGSCNVCGTICEHDWTDSSCNVCGAICEHDWTDGTCNVCGAICEHDWTDGSCGVCGAVCEHDWTEGTCGVCGAICEHTWTDGTCGVCGAVCEHDWTDGTCGVCGAICEHTWADSTCGVCGAVCEHDWTDGSCGVCGAICEHDWTDGTCGVCGAICEHTWTDGTCGVCGMVCTHSYENNVCTVCGQTITTTPSIYAKNVSLAFEDEILLNIYFTVSDLGDLGEADMGLLTWTAPNSDGTIDNANAVIPGAVYHSSLGMYSVRTQGIAAKNLSDTVYFKIYLRLSDGSYLYTKQMKYSPITYANNILAGSQHSTEMKTLVVAMLNYGAAAQVYFDYKADQLMNAHLTEAQLALVEPYRSDMIDPVVYADKEKAGGFPSTEDGFIRKSASISFEGAFSIQYYYQPSTTVSGKVQFYYWTSTTYQAVEYLTADNADGIMTMTGEGILLAKVTGIAAKNLDDTVYVAAIYSDGSALYCSGVSAYSIGQYCLNKAGIESDIQPLAAATAVYGYYAKALLLK